MLTMEVSITGVKEVEKVLDKVTAPGLSKTIAERIAKEVVLPKLAQYPGASRKAQPFVSDKQRRYFFAALKTGQIVVPYRRTGGLGKPENWERVVGSDSITLKSTRKYSDLVRTKEKQAKYHKGTWPTDQDIARQSEADAALVATAVLVEMIDGS